MLIVKHAIIQTNHGQEALLGLTTSMISRTFKYILTLLISLSVYVNWSRINGHPSYPWLSVRLWYLQCWSTGDTTVLHYAIDFSAYLAYFAIVAMSNIIWSISLVKITGRQGREFAPSSVLSSASWSRSPNCDCHKLHTISTRAPTRFLSEPLKQDICNTLMTYCKTVVSPVYLQLRYYSLALTLFL